MSLPPLYAVVDQETALLYGWTVPKLAHAYLAGGAKLIQVRVTKSGSREFLEWCDEIVKEARSWGAQVIVNNRIDIAVLSGANGVHVGQDDLPVEDVRRMMPATAIIGVSTHSSAQLASSVGLAPNYVAVGPIYPTTTKDTGYSAIGLDLVRQASQMRPWRPVVAIGGITLARAPEVLQAGATSVAVISDLLIGGKPEEQVHDYVAALDPLSK